MEWTNAIRKHAEMTGGKYRIPKKGTAEYDAVKKLQMGGGAAAPAAKKEKKAAVKAEAMEGVAKGVYTAEAGKGVSFKAKGLPAMKLMRKVRSSKKAVEATEGSVIPKATHLKFDEEGEVKSVGTPKKAGLGKEARAKKPRKTRSDKGKKRGPRAKKEE
jgi:hypothetical protein